ncbi:nicotinamide riboside transporter PnuC [Thalassotalea sp. G2M2-11]|uniref:nicotinamide riboside transporter PnuC n=1 Tax=Thalassotalea sp. G2M2-11 TaxID=2787627 RepID=UPI0019D01194|nr:nicotinamide riboside transporter PnuC [Thalassotalea sp. G2M2-11]
MTEIWQYFTGMPFWEWLAVISALLYVILAAQENIWCWPAALVSTVIYTVIFYDVYLWMDSVLQVYYCAMALYGWYCWQNFSETKQQALKIQSWSWQTHLFIVTALSVISLIVGELMARFTPTDFPYLDSATTVFAVFSTYLVTKKVVENWLYWIVIDAVSIYLYLAKDLQATAALFVIYVVIAIYGYIQWITRYHRNNAILQAN